MMISDGEYALTNHTDPPTEAAATVTAWAVNTNWHQMQYAIHAAQTAMNESNEGRDSNAQGE